MYSCWNRTPLPEPPAVPGCTALSSNPPQLLLLLPLLPARPFNGPVFVPLLLYGLGAVVGGQEERRLVGCRCSGPR